MKSLLFIGGTGFLGQSFFDYINKGKLKIFNLSTSTRWRNDLLELGAPVVTVLKVKSATLGIGGGLTKIS